jgi:hypothetical protein
MPKSRDRADDLYALPLEDFTRARDELVKELRAAGDREAADAARAIRKPSVPAWAVNQVARADPKGIAALFAAGDRLREAQSNLVRGGDPDAVKDAGTEERAVVAGLVREAARMLQESGNNANEGTLSRIADTFYATAVDADGMELVRTGRLTKELKRVGFGEAAGLSVVPAGRASREKGKADGGRARLEKEAEKLRVRADEAEVAANEADARADELMRAAEDARAEADAAKEQARFAHRSASEARREADKAARRVERRG